MEVLWGIVFIAILVGTFGILCLLDTVNDLRERVDTLERDLSKIADHLYYQEISRQIPRNGTPEQERGSDDTG